MVVMYTAIVVKHLAPTNHRRGRWAVTAERQARKTYAQKDSSGLAPDAARCAEEYALALGWHGAWQGAILPDGSYVFSRTHLRPAFIVDTDREAS